MPIIASDLKFYGSAIMAEDDTTANQGGAIDTEVKMLFVDISTTDNVTIISDDAADNTQTVTITGRDGGGAIVSEALSLNGTSRVVGAQLFERIIKIVVNAAHTGTITVTRDNGATYTEIATLETGVLEVRRPFYNVASDVSGGSTRNFYEKIFIKNTHATLALLSATIKELSDPTGNVTFDLEDAVDDSNVSSNRITAPTASDMLGSFDNTDKSVPGTNLSAASAIGVWLKLTLAAGEAPTKSTYTFRVNGVTT
jgi:hypothetical protein